MDGLADDVGGAAEPLLPRVVADDDRTCLFLLDRIVEILDAIGAAHQGLHTDDRQAIEVDRHLRDARRFGGGRQRHRRTAALKKPEGLEGLSAFEDGVNDFPRWRLLANAALCVVVPENGEPIRLGKSQLVIRHTTHHTVHRGRRPDAQP